MYENGSGVRQSDAVALDYYGKGCDLKNSLGCEQYARLKKQPK
jgi:TPR repeat protein